MDPSRNERVAFVTGAGGCIGRQLVAQLLARGWTVSALLLDHEAPSFRFRDHPRVRSVCGDIRTLEDDAIPTGAVVFHLAAEVHSVPKTATQREQFFAINRDGTGRVASVARRRSASGFVFLSTIAVYGAQLEEHSCDESTPPRPTTPYAKSKLEAERELEAQLTGSVPFVILRPAVVYGPGDRGNFARMIRAVSRGPFPLIDGGRAMKSSLYVADLATVMILMADDLDSCDGETFNVADPQARSMREISTTIATAAAVRPKLISVPTWLLRPAAWGGDVLGRVVRREMPISSRRLRVMTAPSVVATSKLTTCLKGRMEFTPLRDGLIAYLSARDATTSLSAGGTEPRVEDES